MYPWNAMWSGENKQEMAAAPFTSLLVFCTPLVSFTSVAPKPNLLTAWLSALARISPFNLGSSVLTRDCSSGLISRVAAGKAKSSRPQAPTPITRERWAPARHVPVIRVFSFSAVGTRRPSGCRETESQREGSLCRLKLNSSIFHLSWASWRNQYRHNIFKHTRYLTLYKENSKWCLSLNSTI